MEPKLFENLLHIKYESLCITWTTGVILLENPEPNQTKPKQINSTLGYINRKSVSKDGGSG